MNARRKIRWFSLLSAAVLSVAACASPAPTAVVEYDAAQPDSDRQSAGSAPAATAAPVEIASADEFSAGIAPASPYRANRLIIKNGEMNLRVADTDLAIGQITDVAVNAGGYIVSGRTWFDGELKFATLTLGVPVEQFEAVQRQLRAVATTVLSDTASGQDVSDEYVDLQSRLTNLEATAARTREFLAQAKNVEEALQVNSQLSALESEIEQIKGRMNYLKDRAAFSTIVVNLEPQRPDPTPTPTATPAGWMPDKTFEAATGALGRILRALGDLLIWFGVVVAPFGVPVAILALVVSRGRRKKA